MAITEASLKAKIESAIPNVTYADVQDISGGCGASFQVTIVSSAFEKKSSLAKHRLVNAALKDEIEQIHAFIQKTYTPSQWAPLQSSTTSIAPTVTGEPDQAAAAPEPTP